MMMGDHDMIEILTISGELLASYSPSKGLLGTADGRVESVRDLVHVE